MSQPLNPMISAILTLHNEGRLASPSINSALQNREECLAQGIDVEILIILDTPDLGTKSFVEHISTGLPVKIVEVDFGDLSASRNHGVILSRGKYVSFLDGDDLWGPHWLLNAFQLSEKEGDASVIVHPECNYFFGSGKSKFVSHVMKHVSSRDKLFPEKSVSFANPWTSLMFTRKSLLLNFPYIESLRMFNCSFEDWSFNADTLSAGVPHIIAPKTVHFIRQKDRGSMKIEASKAGLQTFPSPSFLELGSRN